MTRFNYKQRQKTDKRFITSDSSAYHYGNGYIITYEKSRPYKYRWQVTDTNYFGKTVYASNTLKDCKSYCDSDYFDS